MNRCETCGWNDKEKATSNLIACTSREHAVLMTDSLNPFDEYFEEDGYLLLYPIDEVAPDDMDCPNWKPRQLATTAREQDD